MFLPAMLGAHVGSMSVNSAQVLIVSVGFILKYKNGLHVSDVHTCTYFDLVLYRL